jgi:hypothetical protein
MPVMSEAALLAAGRMIKLTEQREVAPYPLAHPDEES